MTSLGFSATSIWPLKHAIISSVIRWRPKLSWPHDHSAGHKTDLYLQTACYHKSRYSYLIVGSRVGQSTTARVDCKQRFIDDCQQQPQQPNFHMRFGISANQQVTFFYHVACQKNNQNFPTKSIKRDLRSAFELHETDYTVMFVAVMILNFIPLSVRPSCTDNHDTLLLLKLLPFNKISTIISLTLNQSWMTLDLHTDCCLTDC